MTTGDPDGPAVTLTAAELLCAFANTLDVETGGDALIDSAALTGWLSAQGLLDDTIGAPGATGRPAGPAREPAQSAGGVTGSEGASGPAGDLPVASANDLELARALRSGLRQAMRQHHDGTLDADLPGMDDVAAQLPLTLRFDRTRPSLAPGVDGVAAGLARLLVAVATCQAEGTWVRLKLCAAEDCLWAFLDTSKNRSRHWCSMGVCGNRQKTRAYRARRRAKE
jgi:predicted RNA-binding Zn ribbon-like protein